MKYALFAFLLLALVSCDTENNVQMVLLSSNMTKDSTRFSIENDTLALWYDFYNDKGPITFTIYNKLNIPIYIDWKKCAMIAGTQKYDYWYDQTISFNGVSTREDRITFIPPRTSITNSRYLVKPDKNFELPTNAQTVYFPETNGSIPKNAKPGDIKKDVKVKQASFSRYNSPYVFRNFLTLSTSYSFDKEFYFDNEFWISQLDMIDYNNFFGTVNNGVSGDLTHPYRKENCFYIK